MKPGWEKTCTFCPSVPGNPAFSGFLRKGKLSIGWLGQGRGQGERREDRAGGWGVSVMYYL